MPGFGKTALARALARAMQLPLLSRDEIYDGLSRSGSGEQILPQDLAQTANTALSTSAHSLLSTGASVIIEIAFQQKLWGVVLDSLLPLADTRVVRCVIDPKLALQRMVRRLHEFPKQCAVHQDARYISERVGQTTQWPPFDPISLAVPTMDMQTTDGYLLSLDTIVSFVSKRRFTRDEFRPDKPRRIRQARLPANPDKTMDLAKPAIDIGLFTNQLEPMLSFWQNTVGVPFSELLPVAKGAHQYRHAIGKSIFKLNNVRDVLAPSPASGIRQLTVASLDVTALRHIIDPDGNSLTMVPQHAGTPPLSIHLVVSNLDTHRRFYGQALGLPEHRHGQFMGGETRLVLEEGEATLDPIQLGVGYRYLTLQIFDVVKAHAQVLSNGGREGSAPRRLGDVAYISFVRDPDGNWIELSQRKSIVGSLA